MEENNAQFDFIAVGDIVTDAFIRLKEAEVHTDLRPAERQICMRFGDKIPYESVTEVPAVGNSPNAATAAARLGLHAALITDLGDDLEGHRCLTRLKENGVSTTFVRAHSGIKTNYHYVLWFQDDRTILIKHEEYPYAWPDPANGRPSVDKPRWLYLSSLGANSLDYQQQISDYLESHPKVKLAFQPGTFQIKLGPEKLPRLFQRSEVFFCNVEEAKRILRREGGSALELLRAVSELGPKIVVITDGPNGAYAYHHNEAWFMPPYPDPRPPINRTGAGDAFASTFTAALALGKTVPEALAWAPINSMSVVQKVGAQAGLLTRVELEKYLAAAPPEYKLKILV